MRVFLNRVSGVRITPGSPLHSWSASRSDPLTPAQTRIDRVSTRETGCQKVVSPLAGWWAALWRWVYALGDQQIDVPCPRCQTPVTVHLRRGRPGQAMVSSVQACACDLSDGERQ